jgi:uncharacterized protein YhaN
LEELSSFEQLAAESSVSQALLAAGLHGARRLPSALDRLRRECERLYSPRPGKRELNQVLRELEQVQERLQVSGDRPAQYFAAIDALEDAGLALAAATAERELLEERRRQLLRLRDADALLCEAEVLNRRLRVEAALEAFPVGGLERLGALERRRERARAEAAAVDAEIEALGLTRKALPAALDLRAALMAAERYAAARSQERALAARRAALAERERGIDLALGELPLQREREWLLARPFSSTGRSRLGAAVESILEAERKVRLADEAAQDAASAALAAQDEQRSLQESLATFEPSDPELIARQREACAELPRAHEALVATQAAAQEARALRGCLEAAPEAASGLGFLWLLGGLCAAGGAAAGIFARGEIRWVICAVAFLLVGALAVVWRQWSHWVVLRRAREQQERERLAGLEAGLRRRESVAIAHFQALGRQAGVALDDGAQSWAEREVALSTLLVQARRSEVLTQELVAAAGRLRRASEMAEGARVLCQAQTSDSEAAVRAWTLLLDQEGLPADLLPADALDVWGRLAELRQRLLDVAADREALRVEENQVQEAAQGLLASIVELGWEVADADAALARARSANDEAREARETRRRLDEREQILRAQRRRWEGERVESDATLAALLEEGRCADAATFQKQAQAAVAYQAARRRAQELEAQVEALAGEGGGPLRHRLDKGGGSQGLHRQISEVETGLERCACEVERHAQRRGALTEQLQKWAEDAEIRALRIQEEELKGRAADLAGRYARDQLALLLLERAQEEHRLKHQPRLLQRVSEQFWRLTRARYGRVWADPEGGLRVLDASKREWSAEALSRGTREQLYLAFRLALVEEICEHKPALPLVLDDILVNFDPERADAAVGILAQLSTRHQVLALTCHPWVRALFVAHGAQVTELTGRLGTPPARSAG